MKDNVMKCNLCVSISLLDFRFIYTLRISETGSGNGPKDGETFYMETGRRFVVVL